VVDGVDGRAETSRRSRKQPEFAEKEAECARPATLREIAEVRSAGKPR
jgi:hypothetical protein